MLTDVARTLGVSRRWLSSLFHEQFGKTPHDYMADIRVKWAKDLLAQSPLLPLKDVARDAVSQVPTVLIRYLSAQLEFLLGFREGKLAADANARRKSP